MSAEHASKSAQLEIRVRVAHPGFELDLAGEIPLEGVTAILGASGSGKSTLLRAIAGFETSLAGRVVFGEELWFDSEAGVCLPAYQRPIGMLFQDARLFAHLDVSGNLDFAERRRSEAPRKLNRGDVVEALELGPLLRRQVDSLSGGETQRVAMARTLLSNPRLLLLDEPLSGLDWNRKAEILPYLEEVTRRFRIPTLFVSHDIDDVARLADSVWVIAEGRLQTTGPIAAIVERLDLQPLTGRFETGAVVEGRVASHDPRLHLTFVDLHGDTLTMPLVERLEPGDPVRLRIRARDVALAIERPVGLSIRNILPGTIVDLVREEGTGSVDALIELRQDRIRARLTWAAVEDLGLEVGTSVFALVKSVSFESRG